MTATFTKNPEIQKVHDRENKALHRQTGCEYKVSYSSWSEAERVARRARQKGRGAGLILAPYRCKLCSGGYHLTTVDPVLKGESKSNRRSRKGDDYDDDF